METASHQPWTSAKKVQAVTSAAVVSYLLSFVLPVTGTWGDGLSVFYAALACPPLWPLWLANPLFVKGVFLLWFGHYKYACAAALVGLALSLSEAWMFWRTVGIGYYAWQGSLVVLAFAGWYGARTATTVGREQRESPTRTE